MIVIQKIEGNSKIGSSVYSDFGKQCNSNYHMFVPSYEESKEIAERNKQESEFVQHIKMYKGF